MTPEDRLAALNRRDLVAAFKLGRWPLVASLAQWLAGPSAKRFARVILDYDAAVAQGGLAGGGIFVLARYSSSLRVQGEQHLAAQGPLLIVSNHPGMADAMAIWATVDRDDLKTVAGERDLIDLLPHTLEHLILVRSGQATALRESISHLKAGGALLTFPAGHIEPDPALHDPLPSLEDWSPSILAIARKVPGLRVVPVAVSGVIHPDAQRSILVRMFRDRAERDWAAATLQILIPRWRKTAVTVRFGPPLDLEGLDPDSAMSQVRAAMSALLTER